MKKYCDYLGDIVLPVVDFRRRNKYIDNVKQEKLFESVYTVFHNYERIEFAVDDDGKIVTAQQIKSYADNQTPINMLFKEAEVIITGSKTPYEINPNGTATQATIVNPDKNK